MAAVGMKPSVLATACCEGAARERRGCRFSRQNSHLTGWVSDLPLRPPPPAAPAPIPATRLYSRIPGNAANSCFPVHGSTFLPSARFGVEACACRPSPPRAVAGSQILPRGEGNSSRLPPLPSPCIPTGGEDTGRGGQKSAGPLGFAAGLASRQPCLLPPQPGHGFCYSCLPFSAMFLPFFFATSIHLNLKREE